MAWMFTAYRSINSGLDNSIIVPFSKCNHRVPAVGGTENAKPRSVSAPQIAAETFKPSLLVSQTNS